MRSIGVTKEVATRPGVFLTRTEILLEFGGGIMIWDQVGILQHQHRTLQMMGAKGTGLH